jgi:hypothetical protein
VSAGLFAVSRGISKHYPAFNLNQEGLLADQHFVTFPQSCEVLQGHQCAVCHHQQLSLLETLPCLLTMQLLLPKTAGGLLKEHMKDRSVTAVSLRLAAEFYQCGHELPGEGCTFGKGSFEGILTLCETSKEQVLLTSCAVEEGLLARLRTHQDQRA